MPAGRPSKRREVKSLDRDIESLSRLRTALTVHDGSESAQLAVVKIDELVGLLSILRRTSPLQRAM